MSASRSNLRLVHQILAAQLDTSSKTQKEIANAVGYANPNVLSMMKMGVTRIPLHIAPKLGKELGLDPWLFTEQCMAEYDPKLLNVINETFGTAHSENERELLRIIRDATGHSDPVIKTKAQAELLSALAKSLLLNCESPSASSPADTADTHLT